MERKNKQGANKHGKQKTVASIVTPLNEGGIGKIMVSGPDALNVVRKVFTGKKATDIHCTQGYKLHYGYIHDNDRRIDEVILNIIKQQDSFTGEDTVEVNCHGGIRILMKVYECIQSAGAEGAPWDEALLSEALVNQKIDLIQKEALQELIKARTKLGAKILLDQYNGALSGALHQCFKLLDEMKRSISGGMFHGNGKKSASRLSDHIKQMLETASSGIALTNPPVLLVLGKPNVGKSTIINTVLGEERMLVHHEPGTTRDYVSECISINGIPFELVDVAGIRDSVDMLESMGIEMAHEQIQRANKIIAIFDNSRRFDSEDEKIIGILHSWKKMKADEEINLTPPERVIIPVLNKCDLPARFDEGKIEGVFQHPLCRISAIKKKGIEDLCAEIVKEYDTAYLPMKPVVFNRRQYFLLKKADLLLRQGKDQPVTENNTGVFNLMDELEYIFTSCLYTRKINRLV